MISPPEPEPPEPAGDTEIPAILAAYPNIEVLDENGDQVNGYYMQIRTSNQYAYTVKKGYTITQKAPTYWKLRIYNSDATYTEITGSTPYIVTGDEFVITEVST